MTFVPGDLARLERIYSKGIQHVARRVVSPRDPRGRVSSISGRMLGGARFGRDWRYEDIYFDQLSPLTGERFVLVELGVLQGAGLAVWCDVFPKARVIGLDIDPGLFDRSLLAGRGAFQHNEPEVYALDELSPHAGDDLRGILRGEEIAVFIDDALHDDRSILTAARQFMPLMAERSFYFVEDNATAWTSLTKEWPALAVIRSKSLTCLKGTPL